MKPASGRRAPAGTGVDTDQTRPEVGRGSGAECLALDRRRRTSATQRPGSRSIQHAKRLAGDCRCQIETGIGQRRRADPLGAEEYQPQPAEHEVQRHGDDQQRQYRGIGDRAERETPDSGPIGETIAIPRRIESAGSGRGNQSAWRCQVRTDSARRSPQRPQPRARRDESAARTAVEQPQRARHAGRTATGRGQRGKGQQIALRHEDDARDGETISSPMASSR